MSSNLQAEYVASKFGNLTVSRDHLEDDLNFWTYLEGEVQRKIDSTQGELNERLKLQDSRRKELELVKQKLNHYLDNGLKKSDPECEAIVERLDLLQTCLKMKAVETSLESELESLRESLENARTHVKRCRFKQKLQAEKAGAVPQSKVPKK